MRPPLACLPLLLLAAATGFADPGSGLPRSTPEAEGMDSAGVLSLVDALDHRIDAVHSVMLLRHGRVVAEGWWTPYAAGDVHLMYSVSKSFTSTAVGFAVQEGRLGLDDKVLSFFPDLAPAHPARQMENMRVRDLLRMTTGHEHDSMRLLRASRDGAWTRDFLETEVEHKPGTHFLYDSGGPYMLAAIIQRVTGGTVEAYLQPRLFGPLGIERHPWGLSPEGVDLGDGGLSLRTEDLAKFGQLYLQKGMWNGRRLLPEKWIEAATSLQASNGSDPAGNWDQGYGYLFWLNKGTGYRADGALGQFCFVMPVYDVVLAVTSGTAGLSDLMDVVWKYLPPAVRYVPLPPNTAAQAALAGRLSSLTLPLPHGALHSTAERGVSGKTYALEKNERGMTSVRIDFSGANPVLTIVDGYGSHAISCGLGRWVRGRTDFYRRINDLFDCDDQGMAACGAWTGDDTFTVKLCFDETPYTVTLRFAFSGDRLLLDFLHPLCWEQDRRHLVIAGSAAGPQPAHGN
jgi:CubicO group peptidase (beta-lactamase class C family)